MTAKQNKKFIYIGGLIVVGILVFIVAYFGLKDLTEKPRIWFDDGLIMQLAKNLAVSGKYGIEIAPSQFTSYPYYVTVGYPVILPAVLSFKIFGVGLWAARLTSVLFMLLLVVSFYYLAKSLYGPFAAAISSLLLVSFPPFYGNGKIFLGEVPGLAYLILSIIFWQKGHRSEKKSSFGFYMAAGLFAGFSLASKPSYFLLIPGFALFLFLENLEHIGKFSWRFWHWMGGFIAATGAWLVITIPRPYTLASFKAVLDYYLNSYAQNDVWQNISSNFKTLFTDGSAIFFLVIFTIVVIGMIVEIYKKTIFVEVLPLYIFVILTFLWWLKTPGWYRYFFPAEIIMFLFLPNSLKIIFRAFFGQYLGGYVLYGLGCLSIIVFQFYWLMFKGFFPTSAYPWTVEMLNSTFKNAPEIFVFDSPEFGFGITNHNFSQFLYYNPVQSIGENALLRPPARLPSVVVYDKKDTAGVIKDVQPVLEEFYKDYIVDGSIVIMTKKVYGGF